MSTPASINPRLIEAIHDYSERGKESLFRDAICRIAPSDEDKEFILITLRQYAGMEEPTTLPFSDEVMQLITQIISKPVSSFAISPILDEDSRGDIGMYCRPLKELGMSNRFEDELPSPESTGVLALQVALRYHGWMPLRELCSKISISGNRANQFDIMAEAIHIPDPSKHYIELRTRTQTRRFVSPEFAALAYEKLRPLVPEPIQEGEHPLSHFRNEGSYIKPWVDILINTANQHIPPMREETIIRTRRVHRHFSAICLTKECVQALLEMKIIQLRPGQEKSRRKYDCISTKGVRDNVQMAGQVLNRILELREQQAAHPIESEALLHRTETPSNGMSR